MRYPHFGSMLMLACLCLCLCLGAQAQPRPRLVLGTEISPPFVQLDQGRIAGITTEKIRTVMERTGVDYSLEILPFKRAYLLAQTRPDVCIFSLTRIPEREALFKWVGPIQRSDWTLFGRAGREYGVATLEDARKYRIGAYFGDVRGDALAAQGYAVSTVRERLSNPRKLLVDRIDLWVTSMQMAGTLLADNGWDKQIVPVLTFRRTELYLGCHLGVPDELIAKMNAALRALDTEGVAAAIERKYRPSAAQARP
jgi:polar amino acid transport system substrate-binding protein